MNQYCSLTGVVSQQDNVFKINRTTINYNLEKFLKKRVQFQYCPADNKVKNIMVVESLDISEALVEFSGDDGEVCTEMDKDGNIYWTLIGYTENGYCSSKFRFSDIQKFIQEHPEVLEIRKVEELS